MGTFTSQTNRVGSSLNLHRQSPSTLLCSLGTTLDIAAGWKRILGLNSADVLGLLAPPHFPSIVFSVTNNLFRLVINLAKEINTPELLPSAFYDLSRASPSKIATGDVPPGPIGRSEVHILADHELINALKGREHTSHYLSTFVVNDLESRECSVGCLHRHEPDPFRRRICQATFEATTFEILRDVNGVVYHRSSDPLFAMMDADLMQTRNESGGSRLYFLHRACEPCRLEFTASVENAREEMWSKLPFWFNIDLPSWP